MKAKLNSENTRLRGLKLAALYFSVRKYVQSVTTVATDNGQTCALIRVCARRQCDTNPQHMDKNLVRSPNRITSRETNRLITFTRDVTLILMSSLDVILLFYFCLFFVLFCFKLRSPPMFVSWRISLVYCFVGAKFRPCSKTLWLRLCVKLLESKLSMRFYCMVSCNV
jgi:hypothetical protein